ncbi:MAG: hypothetical protein NTU60_01405 [Candidatus Aminicenantes bacterium]|nr:hypothetical protein [Candidatus Aminicenantes bacterium]
MRSKEMCPGAPGLSFHSRCFAPQPLTLITVSPFSSMIRSSTGSPPVRKYDPWTSRTSRSKWSKMLTPAGKPCVSHSRCVSCQNHS